MGFWNGVVHLTPLPLNPPGARKDEFLFPHLEASGANPPCRLPFSREPPYNITMACFQFCWLFSFSVLLISCLYFTRYLGFTYI